MDAGNARSLSMIAELRYDFHDDNCPNPVTRRQSHSAESRDSLLCFPVRKGDARPLRLRGAAHFRRRLLARLFAPQRDPAQHRFRLVRRHLCNLRLRFPDGHHAGRRICTGHGAAGAADCWRASRPRSPLRWRQSRSPSLSASSLPGSTGDLGLSPPPSWPARWPSAYGSTSAGWSLPPTPGSLSPRKVCPAPSRSPKRPTARRSTLSRRSPATAFPYPRPSSPLQPRPMPRAC